MTTEIKSYSRTIDLRANITVVDLDHLEYDVQVLDDGKKRTAIFHAQTDEDREKITAAGYTYHNTHNQPDAAPSAPKGLDEKAMVSNLTIKGWSGRAFDSAVTEVILDQYGAQEKMGRFTKKLVHSDALAKIKAAEAEARKLHKTSTLPWNENGDRLLPAKGFHDYQTKMSEIRTGWMAAVNDFLNDYDDIKNEAEALLGGMFDSNDYPTVDELRQKYVFEPELTPLDAKGDFRVSMSEGEMTALQEHIKAQTERRLGLAMTEVYRRVHDVVSHAAERLAAYDPAHEETGPDGKVVTKIKNRFKEATLTHIKDVVDMLPVLNVTNDPHLDLVADEIRNTILVADAHELRDDHDKRADVAKAAEEIAGKMAAFM